jgi:DNA-binding LytR/AlgR family response regulator
VQKEPFEISRIHVPSESDCEFNPLRMNALIIDDDAASREIIGKLAEKVTDLTIIKACSSAFEASEVLRNEAIDLLLLDIQMPEMNGLEFIESLALRPQVIFISGNPDYAVDAFKFDVTDFLVKPVSPARFLQAVEKARKRYEDSLEHIFLGDFLFVKDGTVIKKLAYNEITYVEALADYMMIHTVRGKHMVLTPMHTIEKKLPSDRFIRVHRSYLISIQYLEKIEDNTAIIGDKLIPVGVTYRNRLLKRINIV